MSEVVRAALATVVEGRTLEPSTRRAAAMGAVMDGEATPAQLAALLVALRMRGETVDELAGFAVAMRDRVVRVDGAGRHDRPRRDRRRRQRHVQHLDDGGARGRRGRRAGRQARQPGDHLAVRLGRRPRRARASGSTTTRRARPRRSGATASRSSSPRRSTRRCATPARPAARSASGPSFNLLGPLTNPAGATRQVLGVGDADGGAAPGRGGPPAGDGADARRPRRPGRRAARSTAAGSSST